MNLFDSTASGSTSEGAPSTPGNGNMEAGAHGGSGDEGDPRSPNSSSHRCRRCGRPLTNPESIAYGMGPTCRQKAGVSTGTGSYAGSEAAGAGDYYDKFLDLDIVEAGLVLRRDTDDKNEAGYRGTVRTNIPHLVEAHSPDGYEFGYGGSGPADLALNATELIFQRLAADGELPSGDASEAASVFFTEEKGDVREGRVSKLAWRHYGAFKADFIAQTPEAGGTVSWPRLKEWALQRLEGGDFGEQG